MADKFKELQMKISAERRTRVEERVREAIKEMALDELRTAREFTQAELSQVLRVDQGSISKLERRTDMYIGTLRRYIEAMGGSLQIRAVFPDGEVQINQFEDAKQPRADY
jgi:transcriptional regulator with XRE-family HTH domain